ncbi:MAG TPA: DMT family transporter [Thermoclostridium sp.]
MGYLYIIIATLLWSFVGVMVKSASSMFSSSLITFGRFLFGFIFLALFMKAKGRKISIHWKDKWIWIGVIGKSMNYIFENIAIRIGYAYSNIIIWPVQSVFLLIMAFVIFREKITAVKIAASIFCMVGVFLVSWKGMSLAELFNGNLLSSILLIFAAIGAGIHVTSQKALVASIDSGNMNFSIFLLSSMVTFIPVPFASNFTGNTNMSAILSLLGLGLVTGVSFYLNAEALKRISFLAAGIISNTSVLFTLLWSRLFLDEYMNSYVISGVIILLIGMILIGIQKPVTAQNNK